MSAKSFSIKHISRPIMPWKSLCGGPDELIVDCCNQSNFRLFLQWWHSCLLEVLASKTIQTQVRDLDPSPLGLTTQHQPAHPLRNALTIGRELARDSIERQCHRKDTTKWWRPRHDARDRHLIGSWELDWSHLVPGVDWAVWRKHRSIGQCL